MSETRKGFLDLPFELRQSIYEGYFDDWRVIVKGFGRTAVEHYTPRHDDNKVYSFKPVADVWSLFVTCKLISKEARLAFYKTVLFTVDSKSLVSLFRRCHISNIPLPVSEESPQRRKPFHRIRNLEFHACLLYEGYRHQEIVEVAFDFVTLHLPALEELTLIFDDSTDYNHWYDDTVVPQWFLRALCRLKNLKRFEFQSSPAKSWYENPRYRYFLALGSILKRHIQKPHRKQKDENVHRLNQNGETIAQIQLNVTKQILGEINPEDDKGGLTEILRRRIAQMEKALAGDDEEDGEEDGE